MKKVFRDRLKKIEFAASVLVLVFISVLMLAFGNIREETEAPKSPRVPDYASIIETFWRWTDTTVSRMVFENDEPVVALVEEPEISDDVMLLAKAICAEAGYEYELDMFMVGNVIMNRLESPWCPNAETISDVIYQKGQYACTWDGNLDRAEPNDLAIDIATRLIDGERLAPKNVIFQSQELLGDGLWLKVGVHYYCYKNDRGNENYEN